LPHCHSRRDFNPQEQIYFCAHPLVNIDRQLVTPAVCGHCTRWRDPKPEKFRDFPTKVHVRRDGPCMYLGEQTGLRDCPTCRGNIKLKEFRCHHPAHTTTIINECHVCFDYEARLARGSIRSWAVGITTAPRREPTLKRCLSSLARAGWDHGSIFAEPGSEIPAGFDRFSVTRRAARMGAWPNWYLALAELYMREPYADAFFVLQDDVVLCRNVRRYLEHALWCAPAAGLVSVYRPAVYGSSGTDSGWLQVDTREGLMGALTCIFPNAAARNLLADPQIVEHRLRGASGLEGIDTAIGKWAHRANLPVYAHCPSLADHIGRTSAMWSASSDDVRRTTARFAGEEFDACQLMDEKLSNQNR
jgi:hypothetical protein